MPEMKTQPALDLFYQACSFEEQGEMNLAEVYYLKSSLLFKQVGNKYYANAAHTLNELAYLRRSHRNYEDASVCVKKAVQIIETHQNVVTPEWLGSAEPVTCLV